MRKQAILKGQAMHLLPEYHSLRAIEGNPETVTVTVRIDGNAHMMPKIQMHPRVIARLVEAFCSGELDFMSFDDHPKRLTDISVKRSDRKPAVKLTARSLTEQDDLTRDWQTADPEIYGGVPWNEQMI